MAVISPVNIEKRKEIGIRAGDTVRVHQKIEEKGKTRLQVFEGLVLTRKHGDESGATFTVRKVVGGVGVEKIFPLYSPKIDKVEIIKRSKVRRAKLYYIRDKAAKEIRRQMRRAKLVSITTEEKKEDVVPEVVEIVADDDVVEDNIQTDTLTTTEPSDVSEGGSDNDLKEETTSDEVEGKEDEEEKKEK